MTCVGIDLGTTISSLALADDAGAVRFARLRDGSPRLRSVVTVDEGRIVVGDEAQALAPLDPDNSFAFFKRRMGTPWQVPHGGRTWNAPQLSAEVIKALVEDALSDFGERPTRAAVTIPAYFGDDARRATQEAASLAGLEVVALPHEPTAACLAYEPDPDATTTQLVYDLGGGTFDVSVVRFAWKGAEVLATAGDDQLGGKDWDDVLVNLIADEIEGETGDDARDDARTLTDLLERARDAKHALTNLPKTAVTLQAGGALRRVEVTRDRFEAAAAPLFARTEAVVERVLNDVGSHATIDTVLLVGGSSRMPRCREILVGATGIEPRTGVDPDAAVATGAALVARDRANPGGGLMRREIRDATAHGLGFVVVSADGARYVNEIMIERNAPIPASESKRHKLAVGSGDDGVLDVYVLQGEAERPLDTNPLGRWTFQGVPGSRKGEVDVDVAYAYDSDGVVVVSASVDGQELGNPVIDRQDRDLCWTEEDPASHVAPDLAVALVIDVSTSMEGGKLQEAKQACIGFVDVLEEAGVGDRIVLVPFGGSGHVAAPLGSTAAHIRQAAGRLATSGSTNMAHGLDLAWQQLQASEGRRVLVLLTDGAPNDRPATLASRGAIVQGDGELIARGVAGADKDFLRQLDSGSELLGTGELATSFRGIARQLTSGAGGQGLLRRRR